MLFESPPASQDPAPRDDDAGAAAVLRVLEHDPDLGAGLSPEAERWARSRLVAQALAVPAGPWEPDLSPQRGAIGLLVLDGGLVHEYVSGGHAAARLVGPGDVFAPWATGGDLHVADGAWAALQPTRLALLDARFSLVGQRCPALFGELSARLMAAAERDARLSAGLLLGRVETRILTLFRYVADRWGIVGVDGITLELPLTHQTIGRLIGARRPTVTLALGALQESGAVARRANGRWILDPRTAPAT